MKESISGLLGHIEYWASKNNKKIIIDWGKFQIYFPMYEKSIISLDNTNSVVLHIQKDMLDDKETQKMSPQKIKKRADKLKLLPYTVQESLYLLLKSIQYNELFEGDYVFYKSISYTGRYAGNYWICGLVTKSDTIHIYPEFFEKFWPEKTKLIIGKNINPDDTIE